MAFRVDEASRSCGADRLPGHVAERHGGVERGRDR
jgi:hypothetical protein